MVKKNIKKLVEKKKYLTVAELSKILGRKVRLGKYCVFFKEEEGV